jgi:hypothetical protein
METDNLLHQQEDIHHHTEYFLGASKVFSKGDTYMDLFNENDHTDAQEMNLYYPFASHPEWELASFLLKLDLSRGMIDEFLKLQLVNITYSISLRLISISSDSKNQAIIQTSKDLHNHAEIHITSFQASPT